MVWVRTSGNKELRYQVLLAVSSSQSDTGPVQRELAFAMLSLLWELKPKCIALTVYAVRP